MGVIDLANAASTKRSQRVGLPSPAIGFASLYYPIFNNCEGLTNTNEPHRLIRDCQFSGEIEHFLIGAIAEPSR